MGRQLAPGDVIGGFRLEQKFHHGGMGTLWKVSRADIAAPLVMKLPFLLPSEDPLTIVSYETEQMIMPRLSGTHVPAFIAAGDFDGPYVVMELIAGRSLRDRLPELPLPVGEVADLGARIADALEDIHRQRVIHLDLKPSNIMIRDGGDGGGGEEDAGSGEVVLLDFGLARHLDLPDLPGEELAGPIGTGVYIAPEQLLDVRNDRRSVIATIATLIRNFRRSTPRNSTLGFRECPFSPFDIDTPSLLGTNQSPKRRARCRSCGRDYFAAASFSGSLTASKVANSTAHGSPSFFSTLRI
jgi:serine/threonine protein kinase